MNVRHTLLAIYSEVGAYAYFGESVTTLEHSLQAAHFARLALARHRPSDRRSAIGMIAEKSPGCARRVDYGELIEALAQPGVSSADS
jgi:hypothetical protein